MSLRFSVSLLSTLAMLAVGCAEEEVGPLHSPIQVSHDADSGWPGRPLRHFQAVDIDAVVDDLDTVTRDSVTKREMLLDDPGIGDEASHVWVGAPHQELVIGRSPEP